MACVWIVHREAGWRDALARWSRVGRGVRDVRMGAPDDPGFEGAPEPDLVVLGVSGDFEKELELAHRTASRHPEAEWLLVAAGADAEEARRLFDTLRAPVLRFPEEAARLGERVGRLRARRRAQALSQRRARDDVAARFGRWFADLELPGILRALDPRLAEVPLLVRGEPGTGRGLLAAYVHAFGGTEGGHLTRIPCEGLDADALGAEIARATAVEAARRGLTLVLEDVERLPLASQRRLRTWVESGLPPALAGPAATLRWIATCTEASASDPAESLDLGLAQVLAALEVRIPPLRERPGAIEPFANETVLAWCAARGEPPRRLAQETLRILARYPWPGNLRELEGVLVRTLAAGSGRVILPEDLRFEGALPGEWPEPVLARAERGEPEPVPGPEPEAWEEPLPGPEAEAWTEPLPGPEAGPEAKEAGAPQAPAAERAHRAAGGPPVSHADGALRRLIGAISHEVRNPLVAIRTFSQLLPQRYDDPEFRGRFAGVVGDDVRRIEQAVDQLARFAGLGPPEPGALDVSALLDEILESHRDDILARRLVVLRELERRRPEVWADPDQLRFAFAGLVAKALELVPERGDVYIASRHHEDTLEGGPGLRVLLRFETPEESLPTLEVEGISLAETALEVALADAVVRSQGGTMTASRSDSRETVILVDLPAPR